MESGEITLKRNKHILLFMFLTSMLLTLTNQVQADNWISDIPELSEFSARDLAVLNFTYALSGNKGSIWPGYSFSNYPVFLNGTNGAILINADNVPAEFTPLKIDLKAFPSINRVHYSTSHELVGSFLLGGMVTTIGNRKTLVLPGRKHWPKFMVGLSNDLKCDFTTVDPDSIMIPVFFHEGFHGWQMEINTKKVLFPQFDGYPNYKPINCSLRCIEGRLLGAALGCLGSNTEKAKQFIRSFFAIRNERWSRIADDLVLYERMWEYQEGTAVYVQYQAHKRARYQNFSSHITNDFNNPKIMDFFFQPLFAGVAAQERGNLSLPSYQLGFALCLFLDRFRPNWKDEIWKDRIWLDDLLRQALHIPSENLLSPEGMKQTKERFGYYSFLASNSKYYDEYKQRLDQEYSALKVACMSHRGRLKVRLLLPELLSQIGYMFTSRNLLKRDKEHWVFKNGLMLMTRKRDFFFKASSLPVFHNRQKGEFVFWPDVQSSDKLAVTINGTLSKAALKTGTFSGQITVEGKGFILNTTSLKIIKTDNELILSCDR